MAAEHVGLQFLEAGKCETQVNVKFSSFWTCNQQAESHTNIEDGSKFKVCSCSMAY